ncbi:MAG TPA: TonB-dependent receptor, partial [Gemmatimonadaceae bacterium]|nr:TonB-dependent receptor [Gemmatimonadaceae bacterium]
STLSVNSDPTKPGQLTIALNGGIGRNVNYMVDGGDNMDDTIGGALQNFNLEAVQEFKIQTMQYKAEYGRSSGGVLTVVTKTGTNNFSGSAYEFFRDKSLNDKTKIEKDSGAPKSAYRRDQYGASLGGPIVKDRAHFFGTYEKTNRNTSYVVNTKPSAAAPPIFPEFQGAAVPTPFKDELRTGKATLNFTAAQFLQVRYGFQKNSDIYGANSQLIPNALAFTTNQYKSVLAGHSWQLGSSSLNDFVYQWTRFANGIIPASDEPLIIFPSGVRSGQNTNTPQSTKQEKSQFKDDFSWTTTLGGSRHDFKTGLNFIHEPILGGDFTTGTTGQFTHVTDSPTSPFSDIQFNGGFSGNKTPMDQYSIYGQDDWSLTNRITLNLGLRYDVWTGFDLDQSNNPLWNILKNQRTYSEQIYKEFWVSDDKLKNDKNNYAPRLGLSWDLMGNGTRMLRAGVGRFYDFPYTNATVLFPAGEVQSIFGTTYQNTNPTGIRNPDGTFWQVGQPLPPNQAPPLSRPSPINVASPTVTNVPYSDQLSAGYSWELSPSFGVNLEAVGAWYKDIPFRSRANPSLDASGNPLRNAAGAPVRRFAALGAGNNFRIWMGGGKANYQGINLGLHGRMANRLELQGFYTLSRTKGNILCGADEFRLTCQDQPSYRGLASDVSLNPVNPWCDKCFGPLNTDARHKVTLSAVYQAPYGINVSGIGRFRSGLPYTRISGTDINGDIFRQDLVAGATHVNDQRGDSNSQLDLRLSRDFRFGGGFGVELIGEMFNIFNSSNPQKYQFVRLSDGTYQASPTAYAGTEPTVAEQRLAQLGVRVHF